MTTEDVINLEARLVRAQNPEGDVRYLGSILMPADEVLMCFYSGSSAEEVEEAGARAGIPFDRVCECIDFGFRSRVAP